MSHADTAIPDRLERVRGVARDWWLFVLRGVVAILFGVIAFVFPLAGLAGLLAFLAAWMLVDGLVTLWHAIAGPKERQGIWFWLDGLVSLAAAAAIFFLPGLSALTLVIVAGAWFAATGVFEIVAAFRRRSVLLGLAGLASLALGALVLLMPGPGLLGLVWLVAAQAVVFGILLVSLGIRLRRVAQDPAAAEREYARERPGAVPPAAGTTAATAPGASPAIAPTAVPAVGTGTAAPIAAPVMPGAVPPANDPRAAGNDADAAEAARRAARDRGVA
jgi:uncharacterized membrane protein HdeD (DUF308 family)